MLSAVHATGTDDFPDGGGGTDMQRA